MALARAHTWNAGDLLTANDLNGEFNNILNNPIALISPTTGAINFNLTAHTNLVPTAITATSGSTGNVLTVSAAGTPIWAAFTPGSFTTVSSGQLLIGTSSGAVKALAIGSTGQVLAVTSSNSDPSWRVVPLDGGLSSAPPSNGAIYYVSTSGVLTPLSIGAATEVLTVAAAGIPDWQPAQASGGGDDPETGLSYIEDFFSGSTGVAGNSLTTNGTQTVGVGTAFVLWPKGTWHYNQAVSTASWTVRQSPEVNGVFEFLTTASAMSAYGAYGSTTITAGQTFVVTATQKPTMKLRWKSLTTGVGQLMFGITSSNNLDSTTIGNGILLMSTLATANVKLVLRSTNGSSTQDMGVSSTAFHNYRIVITSSQIDAYTDGVLQGSLTANISTAMMGLQLGMAGAAANQGFAVDDVQLVTSTR